MPEFSVLGWMFLAWGIITGTLVLVLIYRSVIGMKEDDQLFLDPAGSHFEAEQHQLLAKLNRVSVYAKRLGYASGALLVAMAGVAAYRVSP